MMTHLTLIGVQGVAAALTRDIDGAETIALHLGPNLTISMDAAAAEAIAEALIDEMTTAEDVLRGPVASLPDWVPV